MNVDGIFKLIDAGFTADDIKKMYDEPTEETKEEKEEKEVKKETKEVEKDEAGSDTSLEMTVKALADTVNKLNTSVTALQNANIDGASVDKPNAGDKLKETIDSFLETL